MNIEHGLERAPYAFPFVVSGLIGAAVHTVSLSLSQQNNSLFSRYLIVIDRLLI
jgi:hypothetical protein